MSGYDLRAKYSCQLYIILAADSHNVGSLNMRLSELLAFCDQFYSMLKLIGHTRNCIVYV